MNINKLESIQHFVDADYNIIFDGVNTTYIYLPVFGMRKSFFAWHSEDLDLYSID